MQTRQGVARNWVYVAGLVGVLFMEFLLRDVFLRPPTTGTYVGIATAVEWLVAIALLAVWVPGVEGKGLSSIGIGKFKWRHVWWGTLAFVVATIVDVLISLFLTGTLVEEVFYRGYLIERIRLLTGRLDVAAVASWLLFLAVHLRFFGLGPTLNVSGLAAALVLLYVKERNLWPCIVCHGLNDAMAYLVFPLLFH